MSNWLFPDRDEAGGATEGPNGVDPADADVDPKEANLDADAVEVDPLSADAVEPGTNVLVVGPSMTGKRRLIFDLVGRSPSSTAVGAAAENAGRGRGRSTTSQSSPARVT